MSNFQKHILAGVLLSIFLPTVAWTATVPSFENLNESQASKVMEDFSSNLYYPSVTTASEKGTVGVEAGVVAGVGQVPEIENISNGDVSVLPHGMIFISGDLPFNLGAEFIFLPSLDISDYSLSYYGGSVNWRFSETIPAVSAILDLSLRASYNTSEFGYTQPVNNVDVDISYDNSSYGLTLLASRSFFVLEPFVGLGFASSDDELTATGNATIFDQSFTKKDSAESSSSGLLYLAGLQLDIPFANFAAQYSNVFGNHRYTGKFSVSF